MTAPSDLWFVYDGACPLCTFGASFYRVRREVGVIHGVDARAEPNHPIMQEIRHAGMDLDEGMVIKYQGNLHHGREALILMAQLGADIGAFNKINNRLFRSQRLAEVCYPAMKCARRLALWLNGAGMIGQAPPGKNKP